MILGIVIQLALCLNPSVTVDVEASYVLIDRHVFPAESVPGPYARYVSRTGSDPSLNTPFLFNTFRADGSIATLRIDVYSQYPLLHIAPTDRPAPEVDAAPASPFVAGGRPYQLSLVWPDCDFIVSSPSPEEGQPNTPERYAPCNQDSISIVCTEENLCAQDLEMFFLGDGFALIGCGSPLDHVFFVFPVDEKLESGGGRCDLYFSLSPVNIDCERDIFQVRSEADAEELWSVSLKDGRLYHAESESQPVPVSKCDSQ